MEDNKLARDREQRELAQQQEIKEEKRLANLETLRKFEGSFVTYKIPPNAKRLPIKRTIIPGELSCKVVSDQEAVLNGYIGTYNGKKCTLSKLIMTVDSENSLAYKSEGCRIRFNFFSEKFNFSSFGNCEQECGEKGSFELGFSKIQEDESI